MCSRSCFSRVCYALGALHNLYSDFYKRVHSAGVAFLNPQVLTASICGYGLQLVACAVIQHLKNLLHCLGHIGLLRQGSDNGEPGVVIQEGRCK